MGSIPEQVAIVVKTCHRQKPVLGLVESRLKCHIATLACVAKRVNAEGLAPGRAAIGALHSRQIIISEGAGLSIHAVKRIGDGQLRQRAVGIPG